MDEQNNGQQWQNKDLHWRDEHHRAEDNLYQIRGILLLLVLAGVLFLNGVLVGCFQIMTGYPYPQAPAVLQEYPGYSLLDSTGDDTMASFLIASPGGSATLVTVEKHFLFDRWQLVQEDQSADTPTIVRGSGWGVSINTQGGQITGYTVMSTGLDTNIAGLPEMIPFRVLLLSLCLTALEVGLWLLVRKLRNM